MTGSCFLAVTLMANRFDIVAAGVDDKRAVVDKGSAGKLHTLCDLRVKFKWLLFNSENYLQQLKG
jgi:hypothetical protein